VGGNPYGYRHYAKIVAHDMETRTRRNGNNNSGNLTVPIRHAVCQRGRMFNDTWQEIDQYYQQKGIMSFHESLNVRFFPFRDVTPIRPSRLGDSR